jgi:hypothetical protein
LALGGIVSVLQDMGQPAFVRNDMRGEFLGKRDESEFERWVADRYGSVALPASRAAVEMPNLQSYFVAQDGRGLAQRTQQEFFSRGTLPSDVACDLTDDGARVAELASRTLRFGKPALVAADFPTARPGGYVVRNGVRILGYRRDSDGVRFFADPVVYTDVAAAWIPEVEAYAAGMVNHLLRSKVRFAMAGREATLSLEGLAEGVDATSGWHVFVEDAAGKRTELASATWKRDVPLTITVPDKVHLIAAYVRGKDSAGRFVATGEIHLP